MSWKKIFIRKETHLHEFRTPLVPKDIKTLIQAGFTVFVQSSADRIYKDREYEIAGALLTTDEWHAYKYQDALILGIKELDHLEKLHRHTHAYFSHSFKGQTGSEKTLRAFSESESKLYDFEYFTSVDGKRLISFGWFAGFVGAVLGLQKELTTLQPWSSMEAMLASVEPVPTDKKIAVVGWKGRCGSGVCDTLDKLQISYSRLNREADTSKLAEYDILYNCILLDSSYEKLWFSAQSPKPEHPILIVDISCDYSKPNNPIAVYKAATTWEHPRIYPAENLEIIAIENLPSLIPKESSDYFSSILTIFILDAMDSVWNRPLQNFYKILNQT
jgi:saccharopine dehydrogenase (NAD+, L-lysine-forming)